MASTTGRNDPCPCGSGKKYKHCCLNKQDNVFPFPGGEVPEEAFEQYRIFTENWNHEDGPVPSFMEFQGNPNLATKSIHDLEQKIGDQVFQSKKELQDFVNQHTLSYNNAPQKYFLGLSPSQMYSVLYKKFSDNTAIVELNERVSHELLAGAPILKQCRYLLQLLSDSEKGIKATQLGNFPRKITQDFYDKFVKEHSIFKDTPMKEDDVPELPGLRFFLSDSGLMKKQNGRLSLTQKGKKFLQDDNTFEQYKSLFQFFGASFNWLYGTRYPDAFEFIRDSLIFCLYILKQKGGSFFAGEKLAQVYKTAFPQFVKDMASIVSFDIVTSGFCYLFLDKFAWPFGLVEKKWDKRTYLSREDQYRRSELFDRVFIWKV